MLLNFVIVDFQNTLHFASMYYRIIHIPLSNHLAFCWNVILISIRTYSIKTYFFSHLRRRILQGLNVDCPYLNCSSSFTNKSSFTSHLTRNHKHQSHESFRNVQVSTNDSNSTLTNVVSDNDKNLEINSNSELSENSQQNIENV